VATLYRRRADTVVDESKPSAKPRRGRSEDDVDELPYRSTEMIYRSWHRLEAYAKAGHKPAKAAFNGFLGEFSRILDGKQGPLRRNAAQGFVDSFVQIPASNFQYGPSAAESTLSAKEIAEGNRLWNLLQDASERARIVNELYSNANDRHTRSLKTQTELKLANLAKCDNGEELMKLYLGKRSVTETDRKRSIQAFQMSRYPTLNAWYRLFDLMHGMRTADVAGGYPRISGDHAQPAIFISYVDAWVFCRWAHWDGKSCRLPFEDEWECACKACDFCAVSGDRASGCRCDWLYWWDKNEFEGNRCTANQDNRTGATTSPAAFDDVGPNGHRNGWNLVDMLGNVWEWCELKRGPKAREAKVSDSPDHSARVLRGGSWNHLPDLVRSSLRLDSLPFLCNDLSGFRVCRC
jgi:formylglycine-generating enzyme required for sulfatase activity